MSDEKFAPLKIGMLGLSIDVINAGEWGYVYLPLGKRDSTVAGGREWIRVKVCALESIRAERDIIIANAQGEVKEHTPVELSYQTRTGPYQRVTEIYPLPVTSSHKYWVHKIYDAAVVTDDIGIAPALGKTLILQDILLFADAASTVTIFGGNDEIYTAYLPAGGGSNVTNIGVRLNNANDKIYVTVSAANVTVTLTADELI